MDTADTFRYLDFSIQPDKKTVLFNYELTHEDIVHQLTETLVFPNPIPIHAANGLRALHIALGISYYKIFVPPTLKQPYEMDQNEADFWNDVFQNGLGEFLYVNKLSKDMIAQFKEQDGQEFEPFKNGGLASSALLGIGGGKDSIVAGEMLKKVGVELSGFVMATGEQLGQSKSVADVMNIHLHAIGRTLAPELMNLQMEPGAYRGHVPISLIFGLVGVVVALSQNSSMVIVANESSASIPTAEWEGNAVNHQWSKSFGFEKSLQAYVRQYIASDVTYFSAIRPLTSVAVAKKFANYPEYFEVFTSDNFVFRVDPSRRPNGRWSLESPKSLSSFILLSPWLSETDMLRTFGQNFLDEANLEALFKELVGLEGHPPLDCVGTVEELVLSLNLCFEQKKFVNTRLMKLAESRDVIQDKDWQCVLDNMLKPQPDAAFPDELRTKLDKELAS
jgi:UDP-N-acetyl-alpha-D-muramoyl-L-alanyl-L-glutamate epimerase